MYKITVFAKSRKKALVLKKLIAGCKYSAIESKIDIKPGETLVNTKYILEFSRNTKNSADLLFAWIKFLPGIIRIKIKEEI